jgi:hypothetical protein
MAARHNSLYHNLAGCDAGPGWERALRQRLVLGAWDETAFGEAYREFEA